MQTKSSQGLGKIFAGQLEKVRIPIFEASIYVIFLPPFGQLRSRHVDTDKLSLAVPYPKGMVEKTSLINCSHTFGTSSEKIQIVFGEYSLCMTPRNPGGS